MATRGLITETKRPLLQAATSKPLTGKSRFMAATNLDARPEFAKVTNAEEQLGMNADAQSRSARVWIAVTAALIVVSAVIVVTILEVRACGRPFSVTVGACGQFRPRECRDLEQSAVPRLPVLHVPRGHYVQHVSDCTRPRHVHCVVDRVWAPHDAGGVHGHERPHPGLWL